MRFVPLCILSALVLASSYILTSAVQAQSVSTLTEATRAAKEGRKQIDETKALSVIENLATGIADLTVVFNNVDGFTGINTAIARNYLGDYVSAADPVEGPNDRVDAKVVYADVSSAICRKLRQTAMIVMMNADSNIYEVDVNGALNGKCYRLWKSTVILHIHK